MKEIQVAFWQKDMSEAKYLGAVTNLVELNKLLTDNFNDLETTFQNTVFYFKLDNGKMVPYFAKLDNFAVFAGKLFE